MYCSMNLNPCQSFFCSSNKTLPNAYISNAMNMLDNSIKINKMLVTVIIILLKRISLILTTQLLYLIMNLYCYTTSWVGCIVFLYTALSYASFKSGCGSLSKSLSRNMSLRDGDAEHTSLNLQPP